MPLVNKVRDQRPKADIQKRVLTSGRRRYGSQSTCVLNSRLTYKTQLIQVTERHRQHLLTMFNDSQHSLVPVTEVVVSATFLSLINTGIIVGNLLVLIIVWRTSKLHEPNYFFLCSLSVADLLVGLIYCPLLIVSVVKQYWVFGNLMCHVHAVTVGISLNASLMNLCVISVDRYYFITRPLRYRDIVTRRRTVISIVFVWFHSVFWAIAPLFGWGEYVYEASTATCKPNWNGEGLGDRSYALCLAVICFLVPVLVMIFAYSMIYKTARKQLRNIQIPGGVTYEQSTERNKASKTVLMIIGAFFLCWSVYTSVSLWKLFASLTDLPPRLVRIGIYLAVSNSCLNFYIYAVRDKVFRKGLKRLLVLCQSLREVGNLSRPARPPTPGHSLDHDFPAAGSRQILALQTTI